MSTTLTIRLESDLKDRLDDLATATNRSKSFLAAEAIQEFVDLNQWQLQEITTALTEADAGPLTVGAAAPTLVLWAVCLLPPDPALSALSGTHALNNTAISTPLGSRVTGRPYLSPTENVGCR